MNPPTFSIREAIRFGWGVARRNVGFFLVMLIVTTIVDGIPGKIQVATSKEYPLVSAIVGLLGAAVGLITSIGWTKILLRFVDGEQPTHADLYAHRSLLFKYFLVNLLYGLSILAGLMLFIIPGLLAAVRYSMSSFLVVDRGLGPIQALRKSAEITRGSQWHLSVAGVVLLGVLILGAVAMLVGLLWAIPTAMVASAFIYRRLSPVEPAPGPDPRPGLTTGPPKEWWTPAG